MRIEQAFVGLEFFVRPWMAKWGMKPYDNPLDPAVFYGLADKAHFEAIYKHIGLVVICWSGKDAQEMRKIAPFLKRMGWFRENQRHVAISPWISDDLKACGIPHWRAPSCATYPDRFDLAPRGEAVYMYKPGHYRYGGSESAELFERLSSEFEVITTASCSDVPHEQMADVYRKCFCGVRVLDHDGLSNGVLEMGLMGRRVVYNGWAPNAIPYPNVAGAVEAVRHESRYRGGQQGTRDATLEYISDESWLDADYYTAENLWWSPQEVAVVG